MSGFAAVIRFDGAPADKAMLARMLDAIWYRGPDGRSEWVVGSAAIGHLMLHTTAESLEETQPLESDCGNHVLAMDGWLSNPDELRAELLGRGARLRTRADAELVLKAFEAWGEDCPRHIEGEYAFVVWDSVGRKLFCTKDPVGMRPLHYHWNGKRLLIASDIAAIIAAGDFELKPNLGMMAEHLSDIWLTPGETLWMDLLRLGPSQRMQVGSGGLFVDRYWSPLEVPPLGYADQAEYHEHYRGLLTDVVRRASRTHKPLACEVSGGLDSSAILSVCSQLESEAKLQAPDLRAYTVNFGADADPSIDELQFARAVANHLGIELNEVWPFLPPLEWFRETARADWDMPLYPHSTAGSAMGYALRRDGCRVDLNGEGGDEYVAAPPYYYAQNLAGGNWRGLGRALREDQRDLGARETLRRFAQYGIRPLIPRPLRRLRQRLRKHGLPNPQGVELLSGRLREILTERRHAALLSNEIEDLDPHRRLIVMRLDSAFASYMKDYMSRSAARLGFERRSPFLSRKMVEFAFATPSRQFSRGGQTKRFHRMAMSGSLPRVVLERTTKGCGNAAFTQVLDTIGVEELSPLLRTGSDVLDAQAMERLLGEWSKLPVTERRVFNLWAAFGCAILQGKPLEARSRWQKSIPKSEITPPLN